MYICTAISPLGSIYLENNNTRDLNPTRDPADDTQCKASQAQEEQHLALPLEVIKDW